MSIAKWAWGATFVMVCASTAACGAPADGSESTEENQAAVTKESGGDAKNELGTGSEKAKERPDLPIGVTPICPVGEKVSCTLGPPPVCHCAPAFTLPIGRVAE